MPPRTSANPSTALAVAAVSSSSPSAAAGGASADEIVCPLFNHDGSSCRKRCFGEKRLRSMQEHIRRAHPEHYIPKLPASEDSIRQMIAKIPDPIDLRREDGSIADSNNHIYHRNDIYLSKHLRRGSQLQSANAAAALAQLHNSRPPLPQQHQEWQQPDSYDNEDNTGYISYLDGPPQTFENDMSLPPSSDRPDTAPAGVGGGPQWRFNRKQRPRKSSVSENARKGKHERVRSKELNLKRPQDRNRASLEPPTSKMWEDLLDAAQSATEEEGRDLTPSPRSSVPPLHQSFNHFQTSAYTSSPLQHSLLVKDEERPYQPPALEPFPSVSSSYEPPYPQQQHQHQQHQQQQHDPATAFAFPRDHASSTGSNFHMNADGLSPTNYRPRSSTATTYQPGRAQHPYSAHHASFSVPNASTSVHNNNSTHLQEPTRPVVEHFCAACQRVTPLQNSYACTECICGICRECADVLVNMDPDRASCPRCHTTSTKFKPFWLDLK